MPNSANVRIRRSSCALLCAFFLTGATSLIFEVTWTRLLLLSLGTTPVAMGVVLAAFIGGMAMGAWTAGRRFVRRFSPVVLYAGLEAWIGYLLQIPMGVEGHDVSSRLYDSSAKRIPVQLPAQLVRCRGLLGVFLSPPGLKHEQPDSVCPMDGKAGMPRFKLAGCLFSAVRRAGVHSKRTNTVDDRDPDAQNLLQILILDGARTRLQASAGPKCRWDPVLVPCTSR